MYFPIANAVMERTRQVVAIPLGVADNMANRGMWTSPVYQMGMLMNRPRIFGMGVASGAAGAGQSGDVHVY
jgi:hypothetical protein